MADHSEPEGSVVEETSDSACDLDESSLEFVRDIMSKVKEISNLVTRARLQAKEAEIRAIYALQFAQRAVEEAKSAHGVSESLAHTSHVVATLALQVTNDADYLLEESFLVSSTATQTQNGSLDDGKERDDSTTDNDLQTQQNEKIPEDPSSEANSFDNKDDCYSMTKLQAVFPHDLRTDDMKNQTVTLNRLPIIAEEKGTPQKLEGDATDDVKRKMMLYKDSKLMKANVDQSMAKGDGEALVYEERGMQTF